MIEFDNTENALLHLNNFKNKYLSKLEADYLSKKKAIKITKEDQNKLDVSRDKFYEVKAFCDSIEAVIEENVILKNEILR